MRQTSFSNEHQKLAQQWYHFDATGLSLGRLATELSKLLIGKNLSTFTPWHDNGAHLVVTNISKIQVTGKKSSDKIYWRHTGYPGGIIGIPFDKQMEKDPVKILKWAVKGMLPNNRQRKNRLNRMHVYLNDSHPHEAQAPKQLEVS